MADASTHIAEAKLWLFRLRINAVDDAEDREQGRQEHPECALQNVTGIERLIAGGISIQVGSDAAKHLQKLALDDVNQRG